MYVYRFLSAQSIKLMSIRSKVNIEELLENLLNISTCCFLYINPFLYRFSACPKQVQLSKYMDP